MGQQGFVRVFLVLENEVEGLIGSWKSCRKSLDFDKPYPTLPLMKLGALKRINFLRERPTGVQTFFTVSHRGDAVYIANGDMSF